MKKKTNAIFVAAAIALTSFSAHAAFTSGMSESQMATEISAQLAGNSSLTGAQLVQMALAADPNANISALATALLSTPGVGSYGVIQALVNQAPTQLNTIVNAAVTAKVPSPTISQAAMAAGQSSSAVSNAITAAGGTPPPQPPASRR